MEVKLIKEDFLKKYNSEEYLVRSNLNFYTKEMIEDVQKNINDKMYNYMYNANRNYTDETAMEYFGQIITFGEMFENIKLCASALKAYGIKKGDKISICLPNVPELVYFKYAANRIGAAVVVIDPRTNAERILQYANGNASRLLISILDIVVGKINSIVDRLNCDNVLIVSPADSIRVNKTLENLIVKGLYVSKTLNIKLNSNNKFILLDAFIKKYKENYEKLDSLYEENDVATILFTSGTTGDSFKGVMNTNEAYNSIARALPYAVEKFERGDSFLGCIPFFTAYGSFSGMHNSLVQGWKIIMIPKYNPNKFDELIKKYRPNNALGVPRFWESLPKSKKLKNEDLSFIKYPITGGDKISPTAVDEVNVFLLEHGCNAKLKIGYGATEFGGAVAVTIDGYGRDEFYDSASVGPLLPGNKIIILDKDTKEKKGINEIGEICINGLTMMKGYVKKEDTEKITYVDKDGTKYYMTGDKGFVDEKCIIHIIDRYKRSMLRPDGHTVSAAIIENVLVSHPSVDSCCVVGLKQGDKAGVIPTAFIKLVDNELDLKKLSSEIDEYCSKLLPERDKALVYVQLENLPYTLMGKIDFKKLEQENLEDLDYILLDSTFFK
jgi:long-chain acyl-CoA synthetase